MWIFHPKGFCSIVVDQEYPGYMLCRGRVKGDLEQLFPDYAHRVKMTPRKDYRYRVSIPLGVVITRIAELVVCIDYPNFKNACDPLDKPRHHAYTAVWWNMFRLQMTRRPRKRASASAV